MLKSVLNHAFVYNLVLIFYISGKSLSYYDPYLYMIKKFILIDIDTSSKSINVYKAIIGNM